MNRDGPVIVINNDVNSQKLLIVVFDKLEYSNEIVFFIDANDATEYLDKSKKDPFLILIEVNVDLRTGYFSDKNCRKNMHYKSFRISFFPAPMIKELLLTQVARITRVFLS